MEKPAFASSAYGGYVNSSTRDSALAYAPVSGSRQFLETKFQTVAPGQIGAVQDALQRSFSVYDRQFAQNVRVGDYAVPTRKLGLQVLPMHKPQVVVPEVAASFPDYREEAAALRAVPRALVDRAVAEADYQGAGYVLAREVRMCLRACLGGKREPSSHLADAFAGYFHRRLMERITADELAAAIAAMADYLDAELDCQSQATMRAFRAARNRKPVPPADHSAAAAAAAAADAAAAAAGATHEGGGGGGGDDVDLASTRTHEAHGGAVASASASALSASSSKRLLTAGPMGVPEGTRAPPGMNVGSLRETQINSEAARRGMPLPMPPAPANTSENFRLLGPMPLSSYERDEGRFGSDPCLRATSGPNIRGNPMTTAELNAGTTRTSRQVPGFMGHVPASTFGPAAEQGLGHHQRDSFLGHTNLNQTFSRHVPGTSVYKPLSAINQTMLSNLAIGVAAPNETARMQGSVQSLWAAVS